MGHFTLASQHKLRTDYCFKHPSSQCGSGPASDHGRVLPRQSDRRFWSSPNVRPRLCHSAPAAQSRRYKLSGPQGGFWWCSNTTFQQCGAADVRRYFARQWRGTQHLCPSKWIQNRYQSLSEIIGGTITASKVISLGRLSLWISDAVAAAQRP